MSLTNKVMITPDTKPNKTAKDSIAQSALFFNPFAFNFSKGCSPEKLNRSIEECPTSTHEASSLPFQSKPIPYVGNDKIKIISIDENEDQPNNSVHLKHDKSIEADISFRLISDKENEDKEIERLKNLKNPYDSIIEVSDGESVEESAVVIEKNKALIANYERVNSIWSIRGYDTPFPESNKEEIIDKCAKDAVPLETPCGRNIFSKPDDSTPGQPKKEHPLTATMKINALEMPNFIMKFTGKSTKEPNEAGEQRKQLIINDNKFSKTPLNDGSNYPRLATLNADLIDYKVKAFIEENSKLFEADIDKKKKALLNSAKGFESIGQAFPIQKLSSIMSSDSARAYSLPIQTLQNDIQLTRNVLSDGDGFSRAIAFSMMEYWILTHSANKIKHILFRIVSDFSKPFALKDFKIEQKYIIPSLMAIIDLMTNDTLKAAYELFFKLFLTDPSFENELLKYTKLSLAEYIFLNSSKFNMEAMPYILNTVLPLKEESNHFIISILPKVFGINLIFYSIEPSNLIRSQLIGSEENPHEKSFITLIKSLGRYDIGYRYPIMFKAVDYYSINTVYAFTSRVIEREEKIVCGKCRFTSREISLASFPQASMCKNCLKNGIFNAITRINTDLTKDKYKHFECNVHLN